MMSGGGNLLQAQDLVKQFGGLRALDRVSVGVAQGEAVGIIGPNGSGKTTFVNVVTGVYPPEGGKVVFEEKEITGLPPEAIAHCGIGRTFQIARPFAEMSVLDNLMVAGLALPKETRRLRAIELLNLVSLADFDEHQAGELSFGQIRLLEFARLLMLDPRLILLDEPAAGLHPVLIEKMEEVIRRLQPQKTFLIIEHNVTLISQLCQRIVVFHEGRVLAEGSPDTILNDLRVQEVYFGT